MPVNLNRDHILLGCRSTSKADVIRAIGAVMVELGEATPRYVEGMLQKEEQFSTWVTEGVALPHGTNAVKNEVVRSSVVVAQVPGGVDWGNGKIVYVAIGLAGKGDEQHLQTLASLAEVLQDPNTVAALAKATEKSEVMRLLGRRNEVNTR